MGGQVITLAHLDRPMWLLGYLPKEDRVYLVDKQRQIVSYVIPLSILNYQTAVVRRDFDTANAILAKIETTHYNDIARFLESQGFKEEAMMVATDPDQKFELALQLRRLEVCMEIMTTSLAGADSTDTTLKWKQLSDLALSNADIDTAIACAKAAQDLGGLLLMYGNSSD